MLNSNMAGRCHEYAATPLYIPLHNGDFGLAFNGQVLLSAATTQQVVGVSTPTLPSEPAVHIGAVAAVALPVGAAAAAWVALLHVLVEVGHIGLAQLADHHFISIICLTYMLRVVARVHTHTNTHIRIHKEKHIFKQQTHKTKMFRTAVKHPSNVMS